MRATLLAVAVLASPALAQPSTLHIFGPVEAVHAISGDGSTVVGTAAGQAFRWSAATGLVLLGTLPGDVSSVALAASGDGATIVGASESGLRTEAFRWTAGEGMQGLGMLAPGEELSVAAAVSGDGQVIAGRGSLGSSTSAFRWTLSGGMQAISCGAANSAATAISEDGQTIVGNGWPSGVGVTNAFAWRNTTCLIAPSLQETSAVAVSADGSVVVGRAGNVPARWINGVVHTLPMPDAVPAACSADGATIVGFAQARAFISSPAAPQALWPVLANFYGVDVGGFTQFRVHAISGDGRTVAGTGILQGALRGWVVRMGELVCYPNCDGSTTAPILNVADFGCYVQRFAAGELYADCNTQLYGPIIEVPDFGCFLSHFAAGCP